MLPCNCDDKLILKDDWGERDSTFYCGKPLGHRGRHKHTFDDEWVMEWKTTGEADKKKKQEGEE